ncbi:MAG: chromate transporter [Candidatus Aquilonibacter sp.]
MTTQAAPATPAPSPKASFVDIFVTFLIIGATSFGGGVVAYLRNALVTKKKWLDDNHFLELMSISNTLPGLNATNMSILAGDRIGGTLGSIAAMVGMCLPGFIFMTIAGILYGMQGDRPLVNAALRGVAAAAVGLLAATWFQIGKKSVKGFYDGFFILAAVLMVNYFKLSVPIALLVVGAFSIFAHRPAKAHPPEKESEWIRFLR